LLDRSLEIVRAAQAGDRSKLQSLVPESARFTIWNFDSGVSLGSGPHGAIGLAKALAPATFESVMVPAGSLSLASICDTHEVKVRFTGDGGQAYLVTFKWNKGSLVSVDANFARVFSGRIGPK